MRVPSEMVSRISAAADRHWLNPHTTVGDCWRVALILGICNYQLAWQPARPSRDAHCCCGWQEAHFALHSRENFDALLTIKLFDTRY